MFALRLLSSLQCFSWAELGVSSPQVLRRSTLLQRWSMSGIRGPAWFAPRLLKQHHCLLMAVKFVGLVTECWKSCKFVFCNLFLLSVFSSEFGLLLLLTDWVWSPVVSRTSLSLPWQPLPRRSTLSSKLCPSETRKYADGPDNHQALQLWLSHLLSYLSFSLATMVNDILRNGPKTFSLPLT